MRWTLPGKCKKAWEREKERIDRHPLLPLLPQPISWWLGYRARPRKQPPYIVKLLSILLVTMGAMLANLAVVNHAPLYQHYWHDTTLVPSFAASCVLIYGALEAPFSQPRNLVFGHFISGLIGVAIMKLFMTNSHNEKYLWIAGALSVACASMAMDFTGTVHPPAGATALLPCVNAEMRRLGWNYLPILLIHACLYLGVALLGNNIAFKYPKYWLWPSPPKQPPPPAPVPAEQLSSSPTPVKGASRIQVTADSIDIPNSIEVTEDERAALTSLQAKLRSNASKQ